jgi:acyl-CoA thioesterase-1
MAAGRVQSPLRKLAFTLALAGLALAGLGAVAAQPAATDRPIKIVALGDSLTAGFGLAAKDAFPAQLQRALQNAGTTVEIVNAGVSGDTATGGLERLDWAVPPDTDAVILELGANDMLRGVDPQVTRRAIGTIVRKLRERRIAVLVCGMLAAPNMGEDYAMAFKLIFPDAAIAYGALYYPFFLNGIAADMRFSQRDGLHPTAAGVDVIVRNILPSVQQLIDWARLERARREAAVRAESGPQQKSP